MACVSKMHHLNQICTHLTLGVCSCIKSHPFSSGSSSSTKRKLCIEEPIDGRKTAKKKSKKKKGQEKHRWGYSLDLMLYDDPWKIKKELKGSDLGHLSRLLLPKELAEDLVLPLLGPEAQREAETEKGTKVVVFDVDTQSIHNLAFKFWVSSRSYVFINGWTKGFVNRRSLNEGDEIGFHWDPYKNWFNFSVLCRAA